MYTTDTHNQHDACCDNTHRKNDSVGAVLTEDVRPGILENGPKSENLVNCGSVLRFISDPDYKFVDANAGRPISTAVSPTLH